MANYQVSGSAVTATSTRNNGGTVYGGGTIASTLWDTMTKGVLNNPTGPIVYNTSALSGSRKRNGLAVAAGDFATMTAGSYVMRRVTTTLAGEANTSLRSGASDGTYRRSIHKVESSRLSTLMSWSWDGSTSDLPTYTGVYANSSTANLDGQDATSTDVAATPSRSIPGGLVYKHGKPVPVSDDYDAKTGG